MKKKRSLSLHVWSRACDRHRLPYTSVKYNQIIAKWVDIRARSYVDCYVQIIKRMLGKQKDNEKEVKKKGLSSKAESSLRKKLN